MKANQDLHVQIEGHCDEHGGIQYTGALGEKRARAAKKYIQALGVSGSRIEVISFGKEKPVAFGGSEEDHAKNRRALFVVTAE